MGKAVDDEYRKLYKELGFDFYIGDSHDFGNLLMHMV